MVGKSVSSSLTTIKTKTKPKGFWKKSTKLVYGESFKAAFWGFELIPDSELESEAFKQVVALVAAEGGQFAEPKCSGAVSVIAPDGKHIFCYSTIPYLLSVDVVKYAIGFHPKYKENFERGWAEMVNVAQEILIPTLECQLYSFIKKHDQLETIIEFESKT